jgi:hypothetical protein
VAKGHSHIEGVDFNEYFAALRHWGNSIFNTATQPKYHFRLFQTIPHPAIHLPA